jgi:hypothetical protein
LGVASPNSLFSRFRAQVPVRPETPGHSVRNEMATSDAINITHFPCPAGGIPQ